MRLANYKWYRKFLSHFGLMDWYRYESTDQLYLIPSSFWSRKKFPDSRFIKMVDEEHWEWYY